MTVDDFCQHLSRILTPIDSPLLVELTAREIAAFFDLAPHEIGIFLVDANGRTASFSWPPHSGSAINIPLKSFVTSLVSATARERRGIIDNNFARTPHLHMFEHGLTEKEQRLPMQRVMSVPVASPDGTLRWIIQVSRKGKTMDEAGPPFAESELKDLERIVEVLARIVR